MTPQDAWAAIEARFVGKPAISRSAKKGFAEGGLMTSGKLFAIPHRGDRLLLKLPAGRIEALIAAGQGERFAMGKDGSRVMKEWVLAQPDAAEEWPALAAEAEAFVREQAGS